MSSQTTEHPETEGSFRGHEVLPIQALLFCFRAGGLATGIPQSCFLGQQILPQLFGQAQWHLLNVAASSAAVAATQSFCRGFPNSIPTAPNSSIRAASGRLSFPRSPGSLEPGAVLAAPVPPRKALLSSAMAAPSGRAAVLLRVGRVPGLSPVPRRYLYKKKWVRTGGAPRLFSSLRSVTLLAVPLPSHLLLLPPFHPLYPLPPPPQLCYCCTPSPLHPSRLSLHPPAPLTPLS